MRARTIRAIAVAAAMSFVLAACGQKPGVHVEGGDLAAQGQGGGGGSLNVDPGEDGEGGFAAEDNGGDLGGGETAAAEGDDGGASAGTGGSAQGDTGGGGGGGGDDTGGGSGGGGGDDQQGDQGQQGSREPQGSDRTGADDDKLVFGLHAPVTGAAPLPTPSFEKSGDLYWRYIVEDKDETVLGRENVQLIFRDDKYRPDDARQVCRELAGKAFALAGGGGTDQIQACGQLAERGKFPYFSAGVTEAGLAGNPWYFATSMSYRQQGILLANMVAKNPYKDPKIAEVLSGEKKIAAIVTDTPNFDDAVQGWQQGMKQFGIDKHSFEIYRHPKGDTSWYDTIASRFQSNDVAVVYILSSPVDYIDFSQRANDSYGYNPRYIGVGVSMGLNAVLGSGCGGEDVRVDKGIFFSPFPGIDKADKEFKDAASHHQVPDDDIAYALWGANKVTHQLLLRYQQIFGNDLTREDFRAVVEQQTGVKSGVMPELNYSPDDHFGADQVHVLQADCSTKKYKTLDTFKSQF